MRIIGHPVIRHDFEKMIVVKAMEGGLTTDEYMSRLQTDFASTGEIIALAMAIEAQALDLYYRASQHAADKENRQVLSQIAAEEQTHLTLLGQLMEQT
jgi:rubrerythrin